MGFKWEYIPKQSVVGFTYKDSICNNAINEFFGNDVNNKVFYRSDDIATLYQGIQALKRFVAEHKQ